MPAYSLSVISILGLTAVVSGGLALSAGSGWPTALLTALGLTLTVAGLLLQAHRLLKPKESTNDNGH